MMKKLFLMTTMFCCGIATARADTYKLENRTLKPRVDLTARSGNSHNHIGTIGAWVPLSQNDNEVLYSDFRFTRQNSDNDEANIGFGYRSMNIVPGAVVGAYVWYDNRHTNRGTIVHQSTVGAEYMSDKFEARANVYAPIAAHAKTWITPNVGSTTPYLAGTGIYVDTTGIIIEEPQPGFDIEFGAPFTPAEKYIDSLRIYGGVYNFHGDKTPDVSGVRVRAVADINPAFQIGTRLQTDIRGAQAYLEATLRFPWSAKLMKKKEGLRSHLDEAPIRDIDIVTGSYVDTGGQKPVLNTDTGTVQRVLYVDNTAIAGGDGTIEHPFNTLATAQVALQDNDILYIARGDGTTTNYNHGLAVYADNVQVIGSGVNFVFDNGRMMPSSGNAVNGTVLRAATANPILTNIDANNGTDIVSGTGVYVAGADSYLTGFTVNGAAYHGVYIDGQNSKNMGDVTISHVIATNNLQNGISAIANTGSYFSTITSDSNTANTNAVHGYRFGTVTTGSSIGTLTLSNSASANNAQVGAYIRALDHSAIDNVEIDNFTSTSNGTGFSLDADTSTYNTLSMHDSTITNSVLYGAQISLGAASTMQTATFDHNTTNNNQNGRGLYILASGASTYGDITLQNLTANGNLGSNGRGITVEVGGAGTHINNIIATNNTTSNNASIAQYFAAGTSAVIDNLSVSNSTATSNGQGIRADANGGGARIGALTFDNNTTNSNAGVGLYARAISDGDLGTVDIKNNTSNSNTGSAGRGVEVDFLGVGSVITDLKLTNNTTNNNASLGQYILGGTSGAITTAVVDNAHADANGNSGIATQALTASTIGSLTVKNSSSTNNTGVSGRGFYAEANGAGSSIGTVMFDNNTATGNALIGISTVAQLQGAITTQTVKNSTANNNSTHGIYLVVQSDSDASTINIDHNTATGNTSSGIRAEATGAGSTITTTNITNNTVGTTANVGIYARSAAGGLMSDVYITSNTSNNNTGATGRGIQVETNGATSTLTHSTITGNTTTGNALNGLFVTNAGSMTSTHIENHTTTGSADRGIYIISSGGGTLGTAEVINSTSSSNTGANGEGIDIVATGAGSTIATATLDGNTTSNNSSLGQTIGTASGGAITTAKIDNATANANAGRGLIILANSGSNITSATIEDSTSTNNTGASGQGVLIISQSASSNIGTAIAQRNTATGNAQQGVYISAQTAASIGTATISGNTANSNTVGGIRLDATGVAGTAITTASIINNTANNNTTQGLYVFSNSVGTLGGVTLTHNTVTGNSGNGVYIDDDTAGTFVVDMGGGTLSGTGQNRIFSNSGTEIRVDVDGGQLKAQSNWWGVGTGLAGGETTLDAGGNTIDASNFLAVDPGP